MIANTNRSYYDEPMIPASPPSAVPLMPEPPPSVSAPAPAPPGPHWRSEDLLGPGDEALITHGDQVYRLRRTASGKLILTK
jgi:hemin uptake protein HemP